jgi:hypothetical protein
MAQPKFCTQCGAAAAPGAHFCSGCGQALDGAREAAAGSTRSAAGLAALAPWLVLASVTLVAVGYFIGSSGVATRGGALEAAAIADEGPIVLAPDISSLSPEERVDRLFNRVMTLAAAGKTDSVQFFAPMAINAIAALMPLDAHRRYDLGLIQLTAGDAVAAKAQADTILAQVPSHLLGLTLAMRVAMAQDRAADARRSAMALTTAAVGERAKGLKEYGEHARDIDDALAEARRVAER